MKYEIVYCDEKYLRDCDYWHCERANNLADLMSIIHFCDDRGLVVKSVKLRKN